MIKKTLLASLISLSLATIANAEQHSHAQSDQIQFDSGEIVAPFQDQMIAELKAKAREKLKLRDGQTSIMAVNSETLYIDTGVFMHEDWIESLKQPNAKDANGKTYDNGVQFAIARIKSKFEFINNTLEMDNINVRFRPVVYETYNKPGRIEFTKTGASAATDESVLMLAYHCATFSKATTWYKTHGQICESGGMEKLAYHAQNHLDTYVLFDTFVRGETTYIGLGMAYSGALVLDNYHEKIKSNSNPSDQNRIIFGDNNAQVFAHELGHVLRAMHNVSESEPATNEDNRAYACGKRLNGTFQDVNDYYNTSRKTIMHSGTASVNDAHHPFFSNPERTIEGQNCGVFGETNNARVVAANAPLLSVKRDTAAQTSAVRFVTSEYIVNRGEGTVELTLERTGDVSFPAHFSLTAKDGTAYELRDFDFGLASLYFEAGEVTKNITVSILPRAERHADTEFELEFQSAVGAPIPTETASIVIISDNPLLAGDFELQASSLIVSEGNMANITISRVNGSDLAADITVQTVSATAIAGTDFTAVNQVVNFAAGQATASVSVPTTSLREKQGSRTFKVMLSSPTNGAGLGSTIEATVTINDLETNNSSESGGSFGIISALGLFLITAIRRRKLNFKK